MKYLKLIFRFIALIVILLFVIVQPIIFPSDTFGLFYLIPVVLMSFMAGLLAYLIVVDSDDYI